jgi:hypothetical protein
MVVSGRQRGSAPRITSAPPWDQGLNHPLGPLDVLNFPLAFSQNGLLTADAFLKEAAQRGIRLRREHLVELHRRRALTPFLRILQHRPRVPVAVPIAQEASDGYGQYRSPFALVIEAAQGGRLIDPGHAPFRSWGRGLPLPTASGVRRYPAVYYSPYQLLALRAVEPLIRQMVPAHTSGRGVSFSLTPLVREDVMALHGYRRLAVLLSSIDMHYLPDILLTIRHPDIWEQAHRAFDPAQRLTLFGVAPEALAATAKQLLFQASVFDPLGRWYELVRHAHPGTWSHLRNAALLAMDYRVAAEILLSALDDLGRTDLSTAPARAGRFGRVDLDDRLRPPPALLEQALTDRGLSPHPALLLVLEGDTEELIMPRVLAELYGAPVPSTLIQCVNMKTIDRDLDLFVRHEAGPRLGRDLGDGVLLERPPTHILVAVDREKKFGTKQGQRRIRATLVRRLHESLPPRFRSQESRQELETLVDVTDWGPRPWEFANFTDAQLADAIIGTVPLPPEKTRRDLIADVSRERRATDHSPDVERVCADWGPGCRKTALAEALWPCLQAKISRAATAGTLHRLPAARVASRALETALSMRRRSVYLRVR